MNHNVQTPTADTISRRGAFAAAGIAATGIAAAGLDLLTAPATAQSATPSTGSAAATPAASPQAQPDPVASSVPHVFDDDDFQYSFLGLLGSTYEQAADIGELFAAAAQITSGGYDSWWNAFVTLGDRVHAIAEESAAAGNSVSAREAYLRASNYYGAAMFYALGTSDPSRNAAIFETHRDSFDAFAALLTPAAVPVTIPYEDTTLPGYILRVDDSGQRRPWLVLNNGSDGTAPFVWYSGGAAALRRGYNVLIFDGPGQGAALYRQQLSFRPDWENVLTPVLDWLLTQPDVDPDRVAVMGMSQGGYWVPRALAFEHRFAAAVADPGVVDVSASWTRQLPPDLLAGLLNAPEDERKKIAQELDAGVAEGAAQDPAFAFTLASRMYPFGTTSFAEAVTMVSEYKLGDLASQITTPLLIADPEGEAFWPGQSRLLYDALPGEKALVRFTAAEGADLHCEPKALGLRAQRFFDWLDAQLGLAAPE